MTDRTEPSLTTNVRASLTCGRKCVSHSDSGGCGWRSWKRPRTGCVCLCPHAARRTRLSSLWLDRHLEREKRNMIRGSSDKSGYSFSLGRFNHSFSGGATKSFSRSQLKQILTSEKRNCANSHPSTTRNVDFACAWPFNVRVADSSDRGETRKRKQEQREGKSARVPTLPCWRRLSPPEAGCRTRSWSWPEPWGRPPTLPRWTPPCSSCGALLRCPQPATSACTFTHSRGGGVLFTEFQFRTGEIV